VASCSLQRFARLKVQASALAPVPLLASRPIYIFPQSRSQAALASSSDRKVIHDLTERLIRDYNSLRPPAVTCAVSRGGPPPIPNSQRSRDGLSSTQDYAAAVARFIRAHGLTRAA